MGGNGKLLFVSNVWGVALMLGGPRQDIALRIFWSSGAFSVQTAKLCYPRLLLCVIAAIAIIAVIAIIAKLYCWQINLILAKMLLDLFAPNPNKDENTP